MKPEYKQWLASLKLQIRSAQIKAAVRVNVELITLYWSLGHEISKKEKEAQLGDKLIPQLSKDLLLEFPDMKGFSKRNLFYISQWVLFYNQSSILQQAVAEYALRGINKPISRSASHLLQMGEDTTGPHPIHASSSAFINHISSLTSVISLTSATPIILT